MTFANMTPTKRIRASGLIGLIVIILFFVVHTMLGALAPKTQTALPEEALPQQQGPGAPTPVTAAATSQTTPVPGAPRTPEEAFPMVADKGPDINKSSKLETVPTGDPFIPLRPTESKAAPLQRPEPAYSPTIQMAT